MGTLKEEILKENPVNRLKIFLPQLTCVRFICGLDTFKKTFESILTDYFTLDELIKLKDDFLMVENITENSESYKTVIKIIEEKLK